MICLTANKQSQGGVAGGQGNLGQTTQVASGAAASSYGYPVIQIATGMTADFTVQLTDDIGGTAPADLNDITKIELISKPCMNAPSIQFTLRCTDLGNGQISFTLGPEQVNNRQGLHAVRILCYNAANQLRKNFRCYLNITKGMTGCRQDGIYPLTIADVRLEVMDTSAELNVLLDDLQFSDMMIASCIQKAVDDWNETPPTLATIYTTMNFPYRSNLCRGAVAYLLEMVVHRYARNRMVHANAGLTMDDQDKQQTYGGLAMQAKNQWKMFVASKKTQQNMTQCFGMLSQPWFDNGWSDDLYE